MGYYAKLKRYGIRGCSLEWCRSYFMNRKQVCAISGKLSKKHIHFGVPQGSNLGPFFYILMICLTALKQLTPDYLPMIQLSQVN